MNDLFTVYRYLALNQQDERFLALSQEPDPDESDPVLPYTRAFKMLDAYVDIQNEIQFYSTQIRSTGGLTWDEARRLAGEILTGYEVGLIRGHGSPLTAAIDFVQKYIGLNDIDALIEACEAEKKRMEHEDDEESAAREEEERLFDLDSGARQEDQ